MGIRYMMVSEPHSAPEARKLPKWFVQKYRKLVDFGAFCWVSKDERKLWDTFISDTQMAMRDIGELEICLLLISGDSCSLDPVVTYVAITQNGITESEPKEWEEA